MKKALMALLVTLVLLVLCEPHVRSLIVQRVSGAEKYIRPAQPERQRARLQ